MWTAYRNVGRLPAAVSLSILLLFFVLPAQLQAADVGSVRGIINDPQERPVTDATVILKSKTSDWVQTATTGKRGEFAFLTVPLGDYVLTVDKAEFATVAQGVTVGSSSSPNARIALAPGTPLATVTVTAEAATAILNTATPTTLVGREDIEREPGADLSNSLAMITNFVPGAYVVHDQLHVRGGHQTTWAVDGVEIPNTNIASNLGPAIDPRTSTTSRFNAAATRRTKATAPTEYSTSYRVPASSEITRANSSRAAAVLAKQTII